MTKAFPVLIPLEKGRTYHSASQAGMDFDEDSHPREARGAHDDKYKPGEFVPKEKPAEAAPQDDPLTEPWAISASRYQHLSGVKQPSIAEISPHQYGLMGKRQREAYDKKRAGEWQASADIKDKWQSEVIAAWDAGKIDKHTPGLSPDARSAIVQEGINRTKQDQASKFDAALKDNRLTSVDQVGIGDRVFDLMSGRYGTVVKKFKTSVQFEPDHVEGKYNPGPRKVDIRGLQWKQFDDVKKDTMKKAFPVLKTAPLPEDTALLSERSELGDSQGGPPPAKPFLIPHAKRPRRRVPNRQGGGGEVLHEEETDRTNLVLDPPVLIPFEKALPGKSKDGHQTPPKGYPEKRQQYGDPENYKYPLDTEEHVRAAWSYLAMPRNAAKYSPEQVNAIKARIKRAGKPHGIAFEGAPLDKDLGLGP